MKRRNSIYEPPKHPDLIHLLKQVMQEVKLNIRTAVPARVIKYDSAQQLVDVEIQFLPVRADTEIPTPPLIVSNAPVAFPRTHTGYITFPLQPGDYGQLIINDRSIDKWLEYGSSTDPTFPHTHNLTDGAFYPGMHPKTDPITPPVSTVSTVVEGPTIQWGRNAVLGVGRLTDKVSADAAMALWINLITQAIIKMAGVLNTAGPVVGVPGTVIPPPGNPSDFGFISQASEKVLSE